MLLFLLRVWCGWARQGWRSCNVEGGWAPHHVKVSFLDFMWTNNTFLTHRTHCPFRTLLVMAPSITLINTLLNKHDFFLSLLPLLVPHDPAQNVSSLVRRSPTSSGKINESLCLCVPRELPSHDPGTNWVVNSLFTLLLEGPGPELVFSKGQRTMWGMSRVSRCLRCACWIKTEGWIMPAKGCGKHTDLLI